MTAVSVVVGSLGALASLFWIAFLIAMVRHRARAVWLAELPDEPPEGGWQALAVLVAARNEEANVERAIRSMLAQDYPNLEVIAVDDRSTDGTGAILDALAAEDSKLRVVHVRELPPGWLGKNHALQAAAEATSAPWLLFTDADVIFAPGALRKAVAWVVRQGIEHVTVAPEVPTEGIGERLFLTMFGLAFALNSPAWKVEDPARREHLGIGAFNLVRADVFRSIGGFRRLCLSIDDDIRLGQALKAAGYRTRLLFGRRAVSVRWQIGLGGMIRGLEKNFFAAIDFRLTRVVLVCVLLPWLNAGPHVGLFVGPWWSRAVCALGVGAICLIVAATGQQSGIGWYYGLTLPLGAFFLIVTILRSTWLTLRRGGVRWRDHHYPLPELREHVRRRNAWIRELWRSTR